MLAAQSRLGRFLFYSFLIHSAVIISLFFSNLIGERTKNYYAVDFYGGESGSQAMSSGSPAAPVEEKTVKQEAAKAAAANPKEDLLIKSKKKEQKTRIVSSVPPIPIPSPKQHARHEENSSAIPSAIPSVDGSGVGVGFGPDGYRGGGGGAGNFPYQWYIQAIKKNLDANWNVTGGYSKRIYAQMAFTIKRDGSLLDVKVEEPSGDEAFDRAAQRAVELSGPFPPLPRDFPESSLRVHVRFTVKR